MYNKTLATLVLCALLQASYALDRDEILDEYGPILNEKIANFTDEYETADSEYDIVIDQIKNTTGAAVTVLNNQIASVRSDIETAKNISANNTKVLDCLKPQEAAIKNLTANSLTANCLSNTTYPDLVTARDNLGLLVHIANITISACDSLNPLPSQDELFLDCIAGKIVDLDHQFVLAKQAFQESQDGAIKDNVNCLSAQGALISYTINDVRFQTTMCLTLG